MSKIRVPSHNIPKHEARILDTCMHINTLQTSNTATLILWILLTNSCCRQLLTGLKPNKDLGRRPMGAWSKCGLWLRKHNSPILVFIYHVEADPYIIDSWHHQLNLPINFLQSLPISTEKHRNPLANRITSVRPLKVPSVQWQWVSFR